MLPRPIDLIRQKVDVGQLPRDKPEKVVGTYGTPAPCDACETKILPTQVAYSLTIEELPFRFHVGCYGLWEAERQRRDHFRPHGAERAASCIDCTAGQIGVSVETLTGGLLRLQQRMAVESSIARCPGCGQLALVLTI